MSVFDSVFGFLFLNFIKSCSNIFFVLFIEALAQSNGGTTPYVEKTARAELKTVQTVKRLLNTVGAQNLPVIVAEAQQLYKEVSRGGVSEELVSALLNATVASPALLPVSMLVPWAALVAALQGVVGHSLGAACLEKFALKFQSALNESARLAQANQNLNQFLPSNVLLVIVYLYLMQVVHAGLICDLLALLTERFKELDVELILLILKHCGFNLRKDDPVRLKIILGDIQTKSSQLPSEAGSSRVRFMLDIITDIKHNKKKHSEHGEVVKPLLDVLANLRKAEAKSQHGSSSGGDNMLQVSLADLLNAGKTGRWWLVGSAWKGRVAGKVSSDGKDGAEVEQTSLTKHAAARGGKGTVDMGPDLLGLAAEQRMHSGVRGQIFCVVMGAADYMDAFEKVLKLNLRPKQQPEILRVLVHCGMQEKTYNPYYTVLLTRFVEYTRELKYSARIVLWDHFKRLEDPRENGYTTRSIINLATITGGLLAQQSLSMYLLKGLPWRCDSPHMGLFGVSLLHELLSQTSEKVSRLFSTHSNDVKKADEYALLWDQILVFFKRSFVPALRKMADDPRKQRVLQGLKLAQSLLHGHDKPAE